MSSQVNEADKVIHDYLDQMLREIEPEKAIPEPPVVDSEVVEPPVLQEPASVSIPSWANQSFECLIFAVAGLRFAVPLVTLGSIHQIDRELNVLPGQQDWFMGILQTEQAGNIKVLDTAYCVMPERYRADHRQQLRYVISIHGYPWGLACDEVERSLTLKPEQVKWRTQRGKRAWLAGTVIDHMCSLIDAEGFHQFIT